MKKIFKVRKGFFFIKDEEAQIVGDFLAYKFPTGAIAPEAVIGFAKPETSPIHRFFEWDNDTAAHNYRMDQARKLVKSITIEIEGHDVPAYHHVKLLETNEPTYLDTMHCMESEDIWEQVLASALKEATAWMNRYKIYKEMAPIVDAIEQVTKELIHGNAKETNGAQTAHR